MAKAKLSNKIPQTVKKVRRPEYHGSYIIHRGGTVTVRR